MDIFKPFQVEKIKCKYFDKYKESIKIPYPNKRYKELDNYRLDILIQDILSNKWEAKREFRSVVDGKEKVSLLYQSIIMVLQELERDKFHLKVGVVGSNSGDNFLSLTMEKAIKKMGYMEDDDGILFFFIWPGSVLKNTSGSFGRSHIKILNPYFFNNDIVDELLPRFKKIGLSYSYMILKYDFNKEDHLELNFHNSEVYRIDKLENRVRRRRLSGYPVVLRYNFTKN